MFQINCISSEEQIQENINKWVKSDPTREINFEMIQITLPCFNTTIIFIFKMFHKTNLRMSELTFKNKLMHVVKGITFQSKMYKL